MAQPTESDLENLPAPQSEILGIAIDMWSMDNPRSVFNRSIDKIQEAMLNTKRSLPEYLLMQEPELRRELHKLRWRPTPADNQLRIKFWLEYE